MSVKLLTEHHLEFLSLTGGHRSPSQSTHVKMPHCWKSHALAQLYYNISGSIPVVKSTASSEPLKRPFSLPTALGFGSLLYLTQALYGEVSVITRWTVRSYPDHGPDPYPWG